MRTFDDSYCTCKGCGEGSLSSDTLVEASDSLSSIVRPLVAILTELANGDYKGNVNKSYNERYIVYIHIS